MSSLLLLRKVLFWYVPLPIILYFLAIFMVGAVNSQVNAGPMVYADAFLSQGAASKLKLSPQHVDKLKTVFR